MQQQARRPDEHTRRQRADRVVATAKVLMALERGHDGSTDREIHEVYWQEVHRWDRR